MKSFFLSLLILSSVFINTPAFAQTTTKPTAIITWQTNTYVPTWYVGKTLPGKGSKISLALMLIDGERVIDISSKKISWFVNNNLISSGVGMTTTTFITDTVLDNNYSIRASIQGYNLKNIESAIGIIPVAASVSITEKEIAGRYIYTANPFYFNTQSLADLSFAWIVQGVRTPQEERGLPGILQLEKKESQIAISVQGKTNTSERAIFEKRN
jgi:hypothetical protein